MMNKNFTHISKHDQTPSLITHFKNSCDEVQMAVN